MWDNGLLAFYLIVYLFHQILAIYMLFDEGIKEFIIVTIIAILWPLFYLLAIVGYTIDMFKD